MPCPEYIYNTYIDIVDLYSVFSCPKVEVLTENAQSEFYVEKMRIFDEIE